MKQNKGEQQSADNEKDALFDSSSDPHFQCQQAKENNALNPFAPLPSEYAKAYDSYFSDDVSAPSQKQLIQQLTKSGKMEWRKEFASAMTLTLVRTDYESIQIELHYGHLALQVKVINLLFEYQFEEEEAVDWGQFGKIFSCSSPGQLDQYDQDDTIIKVVDLQATAANLHDAVQSIYMEYFISYIASELRVGPRLTQAFGYDLVFLNKHAFFSMEKCITLDSAVKLAQSDAAKFRELRNCLRTLHSLHILHCDIKPENICWSPSYSKYVFIDFGLSLIREQAAGHKFYTHFKGTFVYSSPEMKKLFVLRSTGYVDFYYNDVFGLEETFRNKIVQEGSIDELMYGTSNNRKTNAFIQPEHYDHNNNGRVQMPKIYEYKKMKIEIMFFRNLMVITRVKKQLFQGHYEKARSMLDQENCMLRSCLQIINRSTKEDQNFIKIRQQIKNKIIEHKHIQCKIDSLLSQYIESLNPQRLIFHLIPIQLNYETEIKWTHDVLQNRKIVEHLYFIINPEWRLQTEKCNRRKEILSEKTVVLVRNLYGLLQSQRTGLLPKMLRKVCLFYFDFFRKEKNRFQLQSLADIFMLLRDYPNSIRVRQEIIQLTENSLQYQLKYLKFYLVNQRRMFHYIQNLSLKLLKNYQQEPLSQSSDSIENLDIERYKKSKLVNSITKFLIKTVNADKYKQVIKQSLDKFNEILTIIQQLPSKIQNQFISQSPCFESSQSTENQSPISHKITTKNQMIISNKYSEDLKTIIRQFSLMYIHFISQTQIYNNLSIYHKNKYNKILKQYKQYYGISDKGYIIQQINQASGTVILKMLTQTDKIESINQIIQYFYQICQGNKDNIFHQFWVMIWEKIKVNNQVIIKLLECEIKWYDKIVQRLDNCLGIQKQFMSLFQITLAVYLSKTKQTITSQKILLCKQLITTLILKYKQFCQQTLFPALSRISLVITQIIQMITSLTNKWAIQKNKCINQIQKIRKQIKQAKQQMGIQFRFITKVADMLLTIAILKLRKTFHLKEQYLDNVILIQWESQSIREGLMSFSQLLVQLIKIYADAGIYDKAYMVLKNAITFVNKNKTCFLNFKIQQVLYIAIHQFCGYTPHQFTLSTIVQIARQKQKYSLTKMANEQGRYCYFLFWMLNEIFLSLNYYQFRRILLLVAFGMPGLDVVSETRIKCYYYRIFLHCLNKKVQEQIQCQSEQRNEKRRRIKVLYCLRKSLPYSFKKDSRTIINLIGFSKSNFLYRREKILDRIRLRFYERIAKV